MSLSVRRSVGRLVCRNFLNAREVSLNIKSLFNSVQCHNKEIIRQRVSFESLFEVKAGKINDRVASLLYSSVRRGKGGKVKTLIVNA